MPGFELVGDEERAEVNEIFDSGGVLFRHGFDDKRCNTYKVAEFERDFGRLYGSKALAVSSGTAALRVAIAALDLEPGEIITQSFTFVATVEAIVESGYVPVCANIDDTLNMDPSDLESKIGPMTRAVVVVHMLGVQARLEQISKICAKFKIPLIEDTAWGCGGTLNGKLLGSWGHVSAFSFDFAKTITTGEGGMVVSSDDRIIARAREWHDHGHQNNPAVPRWEDTRRSSGFNFRMSELQGAVGVAQLRKLELIIQMQRSNYRKLREMLNGIPNLVERTVLDHDGITADAFVFFADDAVTASKCRNSLLEIGVATKILPEAISWHFAGQWDHFPSLASLDYENSMTWLSRAVSIPVFTAPLSSKEIAIIRDSLSRGAN